MRHTLDVTDIIDAIHKAKAEGYEEISRVRVCVSQARSLYGKLLNRGLTKPKRRARVMNSIRPGALGFVIQGVRLDIVPDPRPPAVIDMTGGSPRFLADSTEEDDDL